MALAFGLAAGTTSFPPGGAPTLSITPAATANTILVAALEENGNDISTHGTLAYNGTSMTFIDVTNDGVNTDSPISLFYLHLGTPDGGAHDIVGTLGGAAARGKITAITITGASTSVGVSGKAHGSTTTPTVTVTTTVDNSFLVDGFYEPAGSAVATGTGNTTNRITQSGGDGGSGWAGTSTTGTAGSFSASYSKTGTTAWGGVVIEVLPLTSVSINVSDSTAVSDTDTTVIAPRLVDVENTFIAQLVLH